jgi:hypothetical protein
MTYLHPHPDSGSNTPRLARARRRRAAAAIAAGAALASVLGPATPAVAADAAFTSAPDVALDSRALPHAIAVGDFNSDRRQDLAIADFGRDRVYSRLGNGDGTFRDGGEVTGLGRPQDVVVGDFDADGSEDLAVAADTSPDHAVTILRGFGDGRFTFASAFRLPGQSYARSLAVGDFDGDARAERREHRAGP